MPVRSGWSRSTPVSITATLTLSAVVDAQTLSASTLSTPQGIGWGKAGGVGVGVEEGVGLGPFVGVGVLHLCHHLWQRTKA
ncbi:MAG: hypothetical protein ACD_31C00102G0001 [uncultured bacterium]|nr:MAG: hypothetical protein ACD_31C00102G0001 [uncultured bacterium]